MDRTLADDRDHLPEILAAALRQATDYLQGLDRRPAAVNPGSPSSNRLPETGVGAKEALRLFQDRYGALLSGSPGPRYFGFVTGGSTPAALAGGWLASAFDQNASSTAIRWRRSSSRLSAETGSAGKGEPVSRFRRERSSRVGSPSQGDLP